jgi:hypothetical protein
MPQRPSRETLRQRRSRSRRRQGKVVLRIEADEYPLIGALQAAGRLGEQDGLRRGQVEQAVAKLISDWVERWGTPVG